ncbi:hypothetical protein AAHA92_04403 [Salvia divinorum]|uniref:Uncharacterized protein n=1 Tax=Salvia divinorum TaxID=28513 RepID=A0ABD1I1L4_SALDI
MSTKTLCLLFIFSCIVVQECKGREARGYGGNGPPVQCNRVDCPSSTVIHSEKEFEIRQYKPAIWVTAPSVVQSSIQAGVDKGGEVLYNYFFEENNGFVDITGSDRGPGGIPDPLDADVVQVTLPKSRYAAVRRVDGEVIDNLVLSHVDILRNDLKRTSYKFATDPRQFTYVMYDQRNWAQGYEVLIWLN